MKNGPTSSHRTFIRLLLVVLVVGPAIPSLGCSCAGMDPRSMLNDADAAFVGTVIGIGASVTSDPNFMSNGDPTPYVFLVDTVTPPDPAATPTTFVVISGLPSPGGGVPGSVTWSTLPVLILAAGFWLIRHRRKRTD
jgi:hypothetical protein